MTAFNGNTSFKAGFIVHEANKEKVINSVKAENSKEKETNAKTTEEKEEWSWYLEIKKISLKAQIKEGTTKEVMDKYIGHFEETSKYTGNVGLAAHNRGYENNYFARLKELKEGDEIVYKYKDKKRSYIVKKHIIIKDTDWTNLEKTKENIITLITCVENQPEYRRCIQAVEK